MAIGKYKHLIELKNLKVRNAKRDIFVSRLKNIKYRGYSVEKITDGREIVISKPGGKKSGTKKEDFFVFVYDRKEKTLWQISHNRIYNDLVSKASKSPKVTLKIMLELEKVYNGREPSKNLNKLKNPIGELPEIIIKAYKWIWGQEDVNYPKGYGRRMSWEGWYKDMDEDKWYKKRKNLKNLLNKLKKYE